MDSLSEHTRTSVRQDCSGDITATDNDGGSPAHRAITEKDPPTRVIFQDDYPKQILRGDIATAAIGSDNVAETRLYHGAGPDLWAGRMSSPAPRGGRILPRGKMPGGLSDVAGGRCKNGSQEIRWLDPMRVAVDLGCAPLVKLLVQQGPGRNIASNEGDTPLQMALGTGDRVFLRVMTDHKGDDVIDFYMGGAGGRLPSI
ncbi:hypothetical protein DL762_001763 [Monosporascus cannonballus]|uniref:Uncharacterized protein n=1 Tax=Monosporascus cannonballus TaxID=155416 RepID=A0ABY0HFW3_9PEZI|nr:hypothetical protein DL762_001763 [Monosporascus cannonballus]